MKKENRGGSRKGAGRPRLERQKQTRRNITLSDRRTEKAKKIGNGNVSEGIRKALDAFGA